MVATVQQMLRTQIPIALSAAMVPVFSGLSADIHLRTTKRVMPDLVKQVLQDGGIKMTDTPSAGTEPRPRRVEGEPLCIAVVFAQTQMADISISGQEWIIFVQRQPYLWDVVPRCFEKKLRRKRRQSHSLNDNLSMRVSGSARS